MRAANGILFALTFSLTVLFGAMAGVPPNPPETEKPEGEKYALLIAASVNKTRQEVVKEGHKALTASGFQPKNIRLLAANQATWENIEATVNDLYETMTEKDMFVLYLAGQGTLVGEGDRRESIFLLWGNTAVRASRLAELFVELHPVSGIVIFDAPHSGDFVEAFKKTPLTVIAPAKTSDTAGCGTFSLVLWKELGRAGKEREMKFMNSLEGAYLVAEAHAKRRSSATPVLQAGYDPENFYLWLPPRDQTAEDARRRIASNLTGQEEVAKNETAVAVHQAADAYDAEPADIGADEFSGDVDAENVEIVE